MCAIKTCFLPNRFLIYQLSLVISLIGQAIPSQAVTFTPLIQYGQARPDANEANTTSYFFDVHCAVIDNQDIVFRAMSDGFREGFDSIWTMKTDGTGLRKLVGKNTKVPNGVGNFKSVGSNNGGNYSTSPFLKKGRVVFFGYDSHPDANLLAVGGLYSVRLSDGQLKRIANYSTVTPSDLTPDDGQEAFNGFVDSDAQQCHSLYAFDGEKVLFSAKSPQSTGVYQADFKGSGLKVIRDEKSVDYPELPDVGEVKLPIANFFSPALGFDSKTKLRLNGYLGASVVGIKKIYANDKSWISKIKPLPDDPTPSESSLSTIQFDQSRLLFLGSNADYFGIFFKPAENKPAKKVVSNLSMLPGMSECPIDNIDSYASDAGRVYFFAHTTNCDGQTANGRSGIFMFKNGKLTRIVGTGDDLGDGVTVVWVDNLLGKGSAQGNKLLFTARTTASLETLYLADLGN